MALQKSYTIKLYDSDGLTIKKVIERDLKDSPPQFRSRINGGLGELSLDLNLPFDDFDEGNSIDFMNIVDVYCVDALNPRGRRIYRGFLSQYESYIESGREGVRITALGLNSLLTRSYYKSGSNYTVTHSSQDPEAIAKAIITHFNSIFGGGLIYYSGSTTAVGTTVSISFVDQKWSDAMRKTLEMSPGHWWSIDADGLFSFQPRPSSATHAFTIGKDIASFSCLKSCETVVNDVQVRWQSGSADDDDATSQAQFGTGSTPTGKFSNVISASDITSSQGATQRAAKEINDNKDEKIKATLVVTSEYDLESIKVGHTCKMMNYKKDSGLFGENMLIVGLSYNGQTCTLELEEQNSDFGLTLDNFVS